MSHQTLEVNDSPRKAKNVEEEVEINRGNESEECLDEDAIQTIL